MRKVSHRTADGAAQRSRHARRRSSGLLGAAIGAAAGAVTVGAGGAIGVVGVSRASAQTVINGNVNFTSFTVTPANSCTVNPGGALNVGTGGLFFIGSGTALLSLVSDASNPGRLVLSGNLSATMSSGTATISTSGTAVTPGTFDLAGAARTFTISDSASTVDMLISARISDGAVRKAGSGLLRLTGSNTYSGGTIVAGGTLEALPGKLGTGRVTLSGATLNLRSNAPASAYDNELVSAGDNVISIGIDSGVGPAGTFLLGPLSLGDTDLLISGSSGTALINGAVTVSSPNAALANSVNTVMARTLDGAGNLTKAGSATLTLSGSAANTLSGTAAVTAGTLLLNKSAGVDAIANELAVSGSGIARWSASNQVNDNATLSVSGSGSLIDLNGFSDTLANVNMTAGTIATGAGSLKINTAVTSGANSTSATFSGNVLVGSPSTELNIADGTAKSDLVISATVAGSGGLLKTGAGTLALTGDLTYTGATKVSEGTLTMAGSYTAANVFTNATGEADLIGDAIGVLTVTAWDSSRASVSQSGSVGSGLNLVSNDAAAISVDASLSGNITATANSSTPIAITGAISGAASVTKLGTGLMTLGGINTYTGGTTVSAGTLSGPVASVRGNISVAAGADLQIDQPAAGSFSGLISGSGDLLLSGAGDVTFISSQKLTGSVFVNAGTMSLTSKGTFTSAAALFIEPGALLDVDDVSTATTSRDRIGDGTLVVMDGGTFRYAASPTHASSEDVGPLVLRPGLSTIIVNKVGSNAADLTFADLLRSTDGMVNFSLTGQVHITGQPAGFIGAWALVGNSAFAKYDTFKGVVPLATGDYSTSFVANTHVKLTSTPPPTGSITIRTLTLDTSANSITVTQNAGTTLTLSQGGLLKIGSKSGTIGGGNLTSTAGELFLASYGGGNLRIASAITGTTGVVTATDASIYLGNGSADSKANTYTGLTYVESGNLYLDKAVGVDAIPGALTIAGGNVMPLRSGQIADTAVVTLRSGSFSLNGNDDAFKRLTIAGGTFATGAGTLTLIDPTAIPITPRPARATEVRTVAPAAPTTYNFTVSDGTTTVNSGGRIDAANMTFAGGKIIIEAGGVLNVLGVSTFDTGDNRSLEIQVKPGVNTGGSLILAGDVQLAGNGTTYLTGSTDSTNTAIGTVDLAGATTTRDFYVNERANFVISAKVTNGALRKSGAGTLQLLASNNYEGGTTLSDGVVEAGNSIALASGPLNFAGGKLTLDFSSASLKNVITTTQNADVDITTPSTVTGGVVTFNQTASLADALRAHGASTIAFTKTTTLTRSVTVENYSDVSFSGGVHATAPSLTLTKTGGGVLTIAGSTATDYTGKTTVSAGRLDLAKTADFVAIAGDLQINGSGVVRLFRAGSITSQATVTLSTNSSGRPTLDLNGFSNTLASLNYIGGTVNTGAGKLTLTGAVTSYASSASAILSGNLDLASAGLFDVADDGRANIDFECPATISGGAGFTKSGLGTLRLSGANSNLRGGITVSGGVLEVASPIALGSVTDITLSGGTLRFNGIATTPVKLPSIPTSAIDTAGLDAVLPSISGIGSFTKQSAGTLSANSFSVGTLSVNAGTFRVAGSASINRAKSVNVLTGARLDVGSSSLIISGTPVGSWNGQTYTGITGLIQSGRNGGAWDGATGMVTSQALATTGLTSIGVASVAQVKGIAPNATAIWNGQTVTGSDTLVMYTYGGDANLDGKIDVLDYGRIDLNVPLGVSGWFNGDFNYDGKIDVLDYGIIDFNIGIQGSPFATAPDVNFMLATTPVPEPTAPALLIASTASICLRRRRLVQRS